MIPFKDWKNINSKFAGFFSIIGNILLFIIKLWAGIVTGSVALVADAWHTLSDSLSSVILLIGVYVSAKPADREHPFGHGRAEIIASLIIGMILVLIAINFAYESVMKIVSREEVEFGLFAIIVTAISLITKEIMARISFTAYRNEPLQSLKGDGWHHRSDALTSAIILIGILLGKYLWWIDSALGLFVSLMIFFLAYRIVKDSIDPLLGEKADEEIIKKVQNIGRDIYSKDLYLHHFHVHRYGNHTELTFHIRLPGDYKLKEANQITKLFIERLRKELDIFATIYIDAYTKNGKN